MQRIRSSILILGLLVVAFLNLRAGLHFHKGLAHSVGDSVVTVYKADPLSEAPDVAVHIHDFVKNEIIETDQMVNVYLFYSYEKQEITELIQAVLIVIAATLALYLSTYLVARIAPKQT